MTDPARSALGAAVAAGIQVQRAWAAVPAPSTGITPSRQESELLLALACRDLVDAVDALPPGEQPLGWTIPDSLAGMEIPEGEI